MMNEPTAQNNKIEQGSDTPLSLSPAISRRSALKALAVATGATAISALPNKWEHPLIEVGTLPAFAQASSLIYPFTSEVTLDPADALLFSNRGWLAVNINNGIPGPPTGVTSSGYDIGAQAIPLRRPFPAFPPSWDPVSEITVSYRFISSTGAIPEDGTVVWLYGVSNDGSFEGAVEGVVSNGLVTFVYPAPNPYSGAFYLSANFRNNIIILTNGTQIDSTFYFATGIFGENAPQESVGSDCGDGDKSPVDVMLLVQLSSGFATDLPAKLALKNFVDKLDLSMSQIGIVPFGNDDAVVAVPLTQNGDLVKSTIDGLAFSGGFTNQGLPIKLARLELTGANHKPGNTPVIVMLSTGQQLFSIRPEDGRLEANAAKEAGIRIITVGMAPSGVNEFGLIRWASSEADYYKALSSVNLVAIYDEISEIVGCPFENTMDEGGDGNGDGDGGTSQTFAITTNTTSREVIKPDLQAGQTIRVTVNQAFGKWRLSLLSPDETVVGVIENASDSRIIQATVAQSGTYKLSLRSEEPNLLDTVGVVGVYEIG